MFTKKLTLIITILLATIIICSYLGFTAMAKFVRDNKLGDDSLASHGLDCADLPDYNTSKIVWGNNKLDLQNFLNKNVGDNQKVLFEENTDNSSTIQGQLGSVSLNKVCDNKAEINIDTPQYRYGDQIIDYIGKTYKGIPYNAFKS